MSSDSDKETLSGRTNPGMFILMQTLIHDPDTSYDPESKGNDDGVTQFAKKGIYRLLADN